MPAYVLTVQSGETWQKQLEGAIINIGSLSGSFQSSVSWLYCYLDNGKTDHQGGRVWWSQAAQVTVPESKKKLEASYTLQRHTLRHSSSNPLHFLTAQSTMNSSMDSPINEISILLIQIRFNSTMSRSKPSKYAFKDLLNPSPWQHSPKIIKLPGWNDRTTREDLGYLTSNK